MSFFKNYALGFVLAILFLSSWTTQAWTGWREFEAEQASHDQPAQVFGADGYVWNFSQATMENWQSEFLQLLTFVALTKFLLFRGSPESRDTDDDTTARLERIEQMLSRRDAG